jgi:hypothetical protein
MRLGQGLTVWALVSFTVEVAQLLRCHTPLCGAGTRADVRVPGGGSLVDCFILGS